jgi:alkanesulfonate monooxygenase SsuD/methylene tetrahydromethanopterin reductase-like flavin-dependent oxidoreductase (luciferase family)
MRLGITLGPTGDMASVLAVAREADATAIDAIGFWDHYHVEKLEWAMISGWSVYGALAVATRRIRLVPMVLCRLNYLPGILAKETAMLSLLSSGRFELGIGAGDYFQEMRAWGVSVPEPRARVDALAEIVPVLRRVWQGEQVTYRGEHLQLANAASTPIPLALPRVVVGVGTSRRLVRSAVTYADELNVYDDPAIVGYARERIAASGRAVSLSIFTGPEQLPDDLEALLATWSDAGVERVFITLWQPAKQLGRIAELAERLVS